MMNCVGMCLLSRKKRTALVAIPFALLGSSVLMSAVQVAGAKQNKIS
jgi:hypothetical protein